MRIRLKFWFFRHYWWILSLVVGALLWQLSGDIEHELALVGTVLTLFYFLQKQRLEGMRLFREIFQDCNARYDKLNEPLNAIAHEPIEKELTKEQEATLMDYFNLCAEEFLYYREGFLYPEVWQAWRKGMEYFFKNPRIRKLWEYEKKENKDSYYGFSI
ncbi:MAG: hypothetical protein HY651_10800 [Acidobacteria bacterium]|nr:hypothetical protein [Acidobacteriota bacterium]